MLKVAVIDYDAGNTLSVTRALEKVGAKVDLTPDPGRVARADAVVLPGVGAFGDCMKKLRERGMDEACREAYAGGTPFLGVCVGLQVLFEGSVESPGARGLAILPGKVVRFEDVRDRAFDPLWVDERDVVQAVSLALTTKFGRFQVFHIQSDSPKARFAVTRAKSTLKYRPQQAW